MAAGRGSFHEKSRKHGALRRVERSCRVETGSRRAAGHTSYIWQLGNRTNINADRGSGIASTQHCKVSVIASKTGIVSQLNTEDSKAGGGFGGALGIYGSMYANRLGIAHQG
jgi:hypothetical protein